MKSIFFLLLITLPFTGKSQTKDLTETYWKVIRNPEINIDPSVIIFHENGVIEDTGISDEAKGDGKYVWHQRGNKVVFRINGYSVHKGKINGNTIVGKTRNKAGDKWTWTATKIE